MHYNYFNADIYVGFFKFADCSFLGETHYHYLIIISQTKLLVDLSWMPGSRLGGACDVWYVSGGLLSAH